MLGAKLTKSPHKKRIIEIKKERGPDNLITHFSRKTFEWTHLCMHNNLCNLESDYAIVSSFVGL